MEENKKEVKEEIKKEEKIDVTKFNLYKKMQMVKEEIAKRHLPKTGKNTYSNYDYYQLEDIMPSIIELCNKYNLFTKPTFNKDEAKLIIIDCDATDKSPNQIIYTSPMKDIDMKGANAIQCLGGVETYQRRYLYMAAFDITEGDMFDGNNNKKKNGAKTKNSDKITMCKKYFAGITDIKEKQEVVKYLINKGYNSFTELEQKNNDKDISDFMEKYKIGEGE